MRPASCGELGGQAAGGRSGGPHSRSEARRRRLSTEFSTAVEFSQTRVQGTWRSTDLHLAPGVPALLRVEGRLLPLPGGAALEAEQVEALADAVLAERGRSELARSGSVDGALTHAGVRFRFNVARRQGGLSVALRRLEDAFTSLAELGLPESLYALCELPDGLVLVSGPTGSGKSTTLASLIHRINQTRPCHVVTIEDPVEYVHPPQRALVNQREVGPDTPDFNTALVASLRQDPDVILVGEIRDLDTIRTAITAAETGHLVFTTVHAGDCVSSIERLVAVFPADEQGGVRRQLALVLRAVIAQHLLPARDAGGDAPRRRVLVSEILRSTPAVANLIASGKSSQLYSTLETGAALGMQTLEHDLARLLQAGRIERATAELLAKSPQLLEDRLRLLERRAPTRRTGRQR
ncbi:MAG: PilT/PilU family type 4a pilus ATPase [Planctomycetota bacterium]